MAVIRTSDTVFAPRFWRVEAFAGLCTYLTMSYIFVLNPSLLAKTGIDVGAAFIATILSAFLFTLLMGLWAKLPYAVAPVPTITTFFVFYVCGKMGLSWEDGLAAVVLSGFLGVLATYLSVRGDLIKDMPEGLKTSIMFAIGGFLIANGLKLSRVVPYSDVGIAFNKFSTASLASPEAKVTLVGFATAAILSLPQFRFRAAPLVGLIFAAILAFKLGIKFQRPTVNLTAAGSSFFALRPLAMFDPATAARFWVAAIILFLVDFYGAIGKFVGLLELTKEAVHLDEDEILKKALYTDSFGTVGSGLLGSASVAVFISSAVGVLAGGTSGRTALWCAGFILISIVLLPIAGAIPAVVNSGILIYIGYVLMPHSRLFKGGRLDVQTVVISTISALVSLVTFGIDKGLLIAFAAYCGLILLRREPWRGRGTTYLFVTVVLLAGSVVAQVYTA